MKDYLLDTNIISHYAKLKMGISSPEAEKIRNYLSIINKDSKKLFCAINVGEIEYGHQVAPKDYKDEIGKICEYLKNNEIISVDQDIARNCYSEIRGLLYEKYAPKKDKKKRRLNEWKDPITDQVIQVQENDVWICAVAKYYNLTLITADKMEAIKSVINIDIQSWIV